MESGEMQPAIAAASRGQEEIAGMEREVVRLRQQEKKLFAYIREKIDHLLHVMGTLPLRPEELDDETLLSLDPIGILGDSFSQVLEHLQETIEDLAVARDEIQAIFDSAGAGILVVDGQMRVKAFNRMSRDIFFPDVTDALGRTCRELICDEDMPLEDCIFERVAAARQKAEQTDFFCRGRYFHVVGTPIMDRAGEIVLVVLVYTDITARKQAEAALREGEERFRRLYEQAREAEQRIQQLAFFDPLTGLPNRTLLQDRLNQALVQAARGGHQVGVVFLDLDRFKNINDTLGHGVGDELLRAIASRLQKCVRKTDTVARLGGDEFVILLTAVQDLRSVTMIARKILEVFSIPTPLAGHDLYTTASIGIALYPMDGDSADVLLKNADTAMYKSKDKGRNAFQFYAAEMNSQALERLLLGNDLRHAIERGEFSLHYQPQVCIATSRLIGVEALMRWRHPEKGAVPPSTFVPLAEESGDIFPLGRWALETACARSRRWEELGFPDLKLAVNLSGRQFRQEVIVSLLRETLEKTGLPAGHLELELTEGMLMDSGGSTLETLTKLKEMGVQLAIDDFGTGYSSLACLKQFPIDRVKIDTSFIRGTSSNLGDRAIAEAVIALAHSLKIKVVAEGVETWEQLAFLRDRGCDEMQGYLCAPALDADSLDRFLGEIRSGESCLSGKGPVLREWPALPA